MFIKMQLNSLAQVQENSITFCRVGMDERIKVCYIFAPRWLYVCVVSSMSNGRHKQRFFA